MDTSDVSSLVSSHLLETLLLVGGLIALLIAITYAKNKDSGKYKLMTAIGFVFGLVMAYEALTSYGGWNTVDSAIVLIASFALIIRPFRDVHFAIIITLLVMGLVYLALGGFAGYMLFDSIDLTFLSEGWPRIIAAFLVGAVLYMILNFAEAIVKLFGKILNWWPLLLILGLICMIEAALLLTGNGTILDYIDTSAISQ